MSTDGNFWGNLMGVPMVEPNTWANTTREPQADLDRQAFLNLLITQLRHQDPLNPMDDRDFIAQMAQFSALEQMQNLNSTFERSQAFGMVGQVIDAYFFNEVSEEWMEIEGLVTSVTIRAGRPFLTVAGEDGRPVDVPFDSVREVGEAFMMNHMLDNIFTHVQGQRASDLIGRWVQAITVNGDNLDFVEGRVDSVKFAGNQAILVVGSREVFFPHEVSSVSDGYMLINSTHFTHGDRLTGVEIRNNNRAYLIFDDGATRVRIQRINHATESLVYVGNFIDNGLVSGMVQSVTIRGGIPFLNVLMENGEMGQVDFLDYLVNRAEGNTGTGSNTGNTGGTENTEPDENAGGENP